MNLVGGATYNRISSGKYNRKREEVHGDDTMRLIDLIKYMVNTIDPSLRKTLSIPRFVCRRNIMLGLYASTISIDYDKNTTKGVEYSLRGNYILVLKNARNKNILNDYLENIPLVLRGLLLEARSKLTPDINVEDLMTLWEDTFVGRCQKLCHKNDLLLVCKEQTIKESSVNEEDTYSLTNILGGCYPKITKKRDILPIFTGSREQDPLSIGEVSLVNENDPLSIGEATLENRYMQLIEEKGIYKGKKGGLYLDLGTRLSITDDQGVIDGIYPPTCLRVASDRCTDTPRITIISDAKTISMAQDFDSIKNEAIMIDRSLLFPKYMDIKTTSLDSYDIT